MNNMIYYWNLDCSGNILNELFGDYLKVCSVLRYKCIFFKIYIVDCEFKNLNEYKRFIYDELLMTHTIDYYEIILDRMNIEKFIKETFNVDLSDFEYIGDIDVYSI